MTFHRFTLLLVFVSAFAGSAVAAPDARFSKNLDDQSFAAAGLAALSDNELAVLDALVRRDIARASQLTRTPRPARFSERLTADERHNAGLGSVETSQLQHLDAAVQRLIVPPVEHGGRFITTSSPAGPYSVPSLKLRQDHKLRPHLAAMVAVGSDGYSAFGAGIELTYENPENDFFVSVDILKSTARAAIRFGITTLTAMADAIARPWIPSAVVGRPSQATGRRQPRPIHVGPSKACEPVADRQPLNGR